MSLFGSTAKTPSFSFLGTPTTSSATTQQSQPSMFPSLGATSTSTPQSTGGLFGALPAPTAPATKTPSLFSNPVPASTAPPAQTPSIFGTAPQAKGGLFGAAPASTAPATQSSLFGATAPTTQASNGLSTQGQQNAAPEPDTSIHAGYFNGLLEKGKKRSSPIDAGSMFGEVPSLQLGLGDLAKRVRQLGPGESRGWEGRHGDSKAYEHLWSLAECIVNSLQTLSPCGIRGEAWSNHT